jgi:hypothetical protein
MGKPLQVVGAIPGRHFGKPCVYLVIQESDADGLWLEQALEVVVETCEWVMAQPDCAACRLHWSA